MAQTSEKSGTSQQDDKTRNQVLGGGAVVGSAVGLYLLFGAPAGGPAYPYGLPPMITAHFGDGSSKTAALIDAQEAAYLWKACSIASVNAIYDFGGGEEIPTSITGPTGEPITLYVSAYQTGSTTINNFAVDHLYVWVDGVTYPADFPLDTSGFDWCTAAPPAPPDWLFWLEVGTLVVVGGLGAYLVVA